MNEFEQNVLLGEAKRLMEEAAGKFFDGDLGRAADLAYTAYVLVRKVQDTNPTREGINMLVAYVADALDHFVTTTEKDV